jgi:hypothetical protein
MTNIKKFGRITVAAFFITAGAIIYINWGSLHQWLYVDRHIKNVEILINPEGSSCSDPRSIYIKIVNNSSRTIEQVKFYAKLTEVGFSNKLNWDAAIVSYKIIKSKESHSFCEFLMEKWDWHKPLDISFRNIEIEKVQIAFMP